MGAQSQGLAIQSPFRSPEALAVGGEGTVLLPVSSEVPVPLCHCGGEFLGTLVEPSQSALLGASEQMNAS